MKIVVTRSDEQADPLVARLEALGHEVVRCPLIRIEPLGDEPIDPSPYDWVVVTSPNGARELARRLSASPRRIAAIGPGTAEALREHGLDADLVPAIHTQEGLLAELPPGRVLLAAAEGARRLLVDERGADFLPLYRTVELRPPAPAGDVALARVRVRCPGARGDGRAAAGRRDRPANGGRGARARPRRRRGCGVT